MRDKPEGGERRGGKRRREEVRSCQVEGDERENYCRGEKGERGDVGGGRVR